MAAAWLWSNHLETALEVMRRGPADPRYAWAWEWIKTNRRAVLAEIADPAERTSKATEVRRAQRDAHHHRALELKAMGLRAREIGDRIAAEEGHENEPFDERTVRRWYKPGKSSS